MLNVALLGLGEWGPNLARNLAVLPDVRLHTLCDIRPERLARFRRQYPGTKGQERVGPVLSDPAVDAVVVATPVHTHFEIAAQALRTAVANMILLGLFVATLKLAEATLPGPIVLVVAVAAVILWTPQYMIFFVWRMGD